MKQLNQKATIIFLELIRSMNKEPLREFESEGFLPLVIMRIGRGVETPYGLSEEYSLSHYYEEKRNYVMRDPEMRFFLVDPSTDPDTDKGTTIIPYSFLQSNMGIYETSIFVRNKWTNKINKRLQAEHNGYANFWIQNLKRQGFLKGISKG